MTTKLSVYCDKIIEVGWLLAVVLVPLFFNVYSSRVFEPDKLTLLRSIVLVMIAAWLIKVLERVSWGSAEEEQQQQGESKEDAESGRGAFRRWLVDVPMVLPTLLMVLVYLISTASSVVPGVSLLGSYQRLQGTYTTLSYIVVFFLILQGMRRREQLDRLVTAVLLTSLSISLYGMVQRDKLDPLPWGGDVTSRVAGNMGNAIFIAAYLIMAIPLAIGRVIETLGGIISSTDRRGSAVFMVVYLVLVAGQMAIWMTYGFLAGIFSGLALILAVVIASLFMDRPVAQFALLGGYSFILVAQVITLVFSQSRGPLLGMLAGVYVLVLLALTSLRRRVADQSRLSLGEIGKALLFAVLSPLVALAPAYALMVVLRKGARWLWFSWLLQAVVGLGLLIMLNLPGTPLDPVQSWPYVGRMGRLLIPRGTNLVRILIWEGAIEMLEPHEALEFPSGGSDSLNALRPLIGYGPESMYVAYNRFYQPNLAQIEARNASPDRAHNEAFDSLIITGLLGFLAYLAVFGGVFYYGLKCLGMVLSARDRNVFIASWIGGGAVGALLAYIIDGSMRFFGVSLPLGCMAGLALYVALASSLLYDPRSGEGSVDESSRVMVIAMLAAIVAHYVEIHFGIAIAASRIHFWVYTGAIVAAGYYFRKHAARPPVAAPAEAPQPAEVSASPGAAGSKKQQKWARKARAKGKAAARKEDQRATTPMTGQANQATSILSTYALLVGVILITMVFDFVTRNFDVRAGNYSIFWLFAVTWLLSSVIVIALAAVGSSTPVGTGDWIRGVVTYLMVSLGCLVLFLLVYSRPLHGSVTMQGVDAIMQIAGHINTLLIVFYIAIGLLFLLMAWTLYRAEAVAGPAWQHRNWWIYPPIVVATLYVVLTTNVQVILADMVYKQALPYDGRHEYDASIPLYLKSVQLAPSQDFYYLFLGRAYLEKGQRTSDVQEKVKLLGQSRDALLKAQDLNPLNTDHSANLARLYRAWGGLITEPAERTKLLEQSFKYYGQALSLSPNNAQLWNEWGLVAYFLGRYDDAVERLEKSLSLDPRFVDTLVFLGDAYQALNQPEEALGAHLKAIEMNPGSLSDQRLYSLPIPGFQERRLDYYVKAGNIDKLLVALEENPGASTDHATNRALGNIYLRQGKLDEALVRFDLAVEADPKDLETCVARGYIYTQQNKTDEAVAEFERCIELAPNDLTSRRNLGGVLRQVGRNEEALEQFEKAESIAPDDLLTVQNLADLYRILGRQEESLEMMKRWVELAPDDYNSHKNLSLMFRDSGQVSEAITQAVLSLELAPDDQKPALQQYLIQLESQLKESP